VLIRPAAPNGASSGISIVSVLRALLVGAIVFQAGAQPKWESAKGIS
jgi:hypothetical protein